MAHNIAHILYNMAQVSNQSNRVDVALLNKFEDNLRSDEYPKGWFKLQTRHITRVNNKIAEVKVDACNHSARWSYKFTKEFARLHGQTCEPQWWRKLLGKDNFPDN